ncbi:MAG: bifunctional precorrin-2 dehydrogenase/sirohydrochlorin ferrochelatase [Desulfobacteraceae bacterium]
MRYYPANLDVKGKSCLVVGGGEVGARKAKTLAACGADVTVLSPEFSERCSRLEAEGVRLLCRKYSKEELDGVFLVFAATDDPCLNRTIKQDADEKTTLCNIADWPEGSGFVLPAVVSRGDLVLTVSTGGRSPALAKKIRQKLETEFGPEYETMLILMGRIRDRLLSRARDPETHKHQFRELIDRGLLTLIIQGNKTEIDNLLKSVLGDGFEYDDLMTEEGV